VKEPFEYLTKLLEGEKKNIFDMWCIVMNSVEDVIYVFCRSDSLNGDMFIKALNVSELKYVVVDYDDEDREFLTRLYPEYFDNKCYPVVFYKGCYVKEPYNLIRKNKKYIE
jgi:hypothetical protein